MFRRARKRPTPPGVRLSSTPTVVTRHLLDSALASAKSSYPNEFGGMIRTDPPGIISELILLPGTTAGHGHANFQFYMLPADLAIVGTVHSHPSGALHPSAADTRLFRNWGRRHIILGAPYGPSSWRAYDSNGNPTHLDVLAADGRLEGASTTGRPGRAFHRPD